MTFFVTAENGDENATASEYESETEEIPVCYCD
jgi:hypothetical protein